MPRGRRNDGDESQATQASQSMTQAERIINSTSTDETNRKVNELVMYLLLADQKKVPAKRAG